MRQEGRRVVAQLNTDPRWPDGYRGVAGSGCGRKNHPVLRGLGAQFPGRRRCDLGRTEIEIFLTE